MIRVALALLAGACLGAFVGWAFAVLDGSRWTIDASDWAGA